MCVPVLYPGHADRPTAKSPWALIPASPRQRLAAAWVFLGIAGLFVSLYLAQRLGFDFGTLFGPCGFKQRYGLPCPTCGMTTAVLAFARGQIARAFCVQPAAGLLCSTLAIVAVASLALATVGRYPRSLEQVVSRVRITHVLIGVGLVVAAGWAVTFIRAKGG